MQKITPNLWFDGDAEDAVNRYTSIFDDSSIGPTSRYDEASAEALGRPVGGVLTINFELESQSFVALNGGPQFEFTPAISFIVNCPTTAAVEELWAQLSRGGEELMPLDSYPFSVRYGWTEDEYGVSWQVIHDGSISERKIVPSLMFVGERCGQAEEAMAYYTSVFDGAEVNDVARYSPDQQPDKEGTVMFADFTLCSQRFAAMDSAREHGFDFTEAISFIVDCADQEEVDYFWESLTADGGEEGQCGWLKDRYGVSWQVVPTVLPELLRDEDTEKAGRATKAMLQMGKIDIQTLEEAHAR
ncbi:VOC family protein [Natrinema salifodinae]|uniref:Glyoxalase superfamily enzyme, possibly 3-demethylubiquinone-9 3-methyltransferase n=1 Tax=Natrinema salifodinae TaxID=1202768 RepID=A0A1I0PU39_9EURY|nr:VOC family protein [Natrinema salifodinae]SEW17933.1 Glyoxalase superfamily enzyme, possibly 3-demethylubiquinone-9 3-methyltransferase [Natrinema salifodinae]